MEFTREQFNKAVTEFTTNYGGDWEEAQVREDYSGRFMYGKTCVGVVSDSPATAIQFMFALADVTHEDDLYHQRDFVLEMADSMRTDSMGRSMIYYFPDYSVAAEDKEDSGE